MSRGSNVPASPEQVALLRACSTEEARTTDQLARVSGDDYTAAGRRLFGLSQRGFVVRLATGFWRMTREGEAYLAASARRESHVTLYVVARDKNGHGEIELTGDDGPVRQAYTVLVLASNDPPVISVRSLVAGINTEGVVKAKLKGWVSKGA